MLVWVELYLDPLSKVSDPSLVDEKSNISLIFIL